VKTLTPDAEFDFYFLIIIMKKRNHIYAYIHRDDHSEVRYGVPTTVDSTLRLYYRYSRIDSDSSSQSIVQTTLQEKVQETEMLYLFLTVIIIPRIVRIQCTPSKRDRHSKRKGSKGSTAGSETSLDSTTR